MALFNERAICRFVDDENPIALNYILIAFSTAVGPTRNQIVCLPLERVASAIMQTLEGAPKERAFSRLERIRRALDSKEWTLRDSLILKRQLNPQCFNAWRKFDTSIFERI